MTAQIADSLNYEGKLFSLFANPLESYYKQHPPRPDFAAQTTMNWRGYGAGWEIAEGRLYLVGLSGTVCVRSPEEGGRKSSFCKIGHHGKCKIEKVGLNDLFTSSTGKVFADWYTGEVRIPHGEMLEYIHAGYASKFERYLLINIENGVVTGTRIIGTDEYEKGKKAKEPWWQFWNDIDMSPVFSSKFR